MSKPTHKAHGSKKQAGAKSEQLVERLRQWAIEMGLREDQLPSNSELKLLATSNGNSLNYIVKHISSPHVVHVAKGNIMLHSGNVAGEREGLLAERTELTREVTSLSVATTQLETDIARLRSDIATADGEKRAMENEVKEVSRKSAVLSASFVKCDEMVRVMEELARRVRQRREMFMHSSGETSYFTRPRENSTAADGSKSLVLETACKRDLRLICEQVVELERLLTSASDSTDQVEKLKSQVWSKVEAVLSTHSPDHILLSLSEITQEAAQQLHSDTARINLHNDAKLLKYHYDQSGGVSDVSSQPNLLHTVQEHLMSLQQAHVERSVESERINQSTKTVRQRLLEVRGQVLSLLSQLYREDPEGAELAKCNLQLELELRGFECSLDTLVGACAELNSARDQRRAALESLQHKKNTIEQFTHVAENKQGHIQRLVKLNSAAKARLQKQKTETSLYIHQNVCSHESQLLSLVASLVDSLKSELDVFSTLSLSRALRSPGLRTSPVQPSGFASWEELLQCLGLPFYVTSDKVIPHLVKLLRKVHQEAGAVEASESATLEVKSLATNKEEARGVLVASRQLDDHQLQQRVPALQQCLTYASQGLSQCPILQQTLQEWWYQPSQFSTPWVTYEGMSLEKWVEQWRVLTAKFRQLSESRN